MKRSEDCLSMTEAEVVERVKRGRDGDEQAVQELFHYMYPHVARLVQANLPAKEPAEDLVQKVCVKVVTHLHQFSGKVPFLHWVSRIAVNTCLNQIRHEKHRPELRLADLSEEEASVVENLGSISGELSSADRVGATELVDKLLAGLRPDDRLLMRLLYLEGHMLKEISELTGWSNTSIKVRAFRARAQLRKRYAILMKETR
jgi:RNA polymerase sigma-70 factor (ECF subfamily)